MLCGMASKGWNRVKYAGYQPLTSRFERWGCADLWRGVRIRISNKNNRKPFVLAFGNGNPHNITAGLRDGTRNHFLTHCRPSAAVRSGPAAPARTGIMVGLVASIRAIARRRFDRV